MISLDDARNVVAEKTQALVAARRALAEARGSLLREEVRAEEDIPAFDRSAMDGYAVRPGDAAARFKIVGEVRAGGSAAAALELGPGECARIFTGGAIPAGAGRVLKQEDVQAADGWMEPGEERAEEAHIRHRGEDARAGDLLLREGTRLGAAELALLAGLGVARPLVSPRARVAHFATGDELVDAAATPGEGQIRDSNSVLVRAFLETHGAEMVAQERLGDGADFVFEKCAAALDKGCDLLLLSGGSGAGRYDFTRPVLERLGFQIHFARINVRPGKPLIFATRGSQAAFGLPGNPVSHFVVLHAVVTAALDQLAGAAPALRMVDAPLRAGFHTRGDGRDVLWPGRVEFAAEGLSVEAARWQSSGDLTGLAGANALIRCPAPVLDTGTSVPCILLHV